MERTLERILGTWFLVHWKHETPAGRAHYPLGDTVRGILVYSADGYMSALLMNASWEKLRLTGLFGKSPDESASIGTHCFGYSGRYELQEKEIIHHVEVSLYPNWIGTRQRRRYHLSNDELLLSAGPFFSPHGKTTASLLWRRRPA